MNGSDTVGLAFDDTRIQLDNYVRQLSSRANTFTIAFFDCCRKEEMEKGPEIIEYPTTRGKYLILYAAEKKKPAIAPVGGMSKATAAFIEYMMAYDSTTIDLKSYLDKWDFDLGDKASNMWGSISVEIPF